ncbi:MinD/ParA family ATP-binding protein [Gordonia insulae]|uniref:ESX-1 secretion-associated protein EspI n=1 Tax=Gordonia insulae TaxID=2420509 RepID=A0A3G8JV59_9ACTN|nr:MinD/ParA family protein [Gordonia insulae]AZG48432.1 ESX-1 secretion-associated protein EspI [Gordonia insulae]
MTYDDSGSLDNSGVPAPPPWLQFAEPHVAEPEPSEAPQPTAPSREQSAYPTQPPVEATRPDHAATRPPTPGPTSAHLDGGPVDRTETQVPQGIPPQYAQGMPPQMAPQQMPPPPAPPQPPYPRQGPPPGPPGHLPPQPMGTGAPYGGGYPMNPPGYGDPHSGPALDEVALIRKARRAPSRGWRRAVHTISAGAINPGESAADLEYKHLLERVNRPVRGDYRIAVLSLKGGVGKTTTTVGLGSTFASLRGDRVIAVDANPDLGTLAQRVPQQTRSTVRDLLADPNVYRYSDVRAHTSQAPSRLEVLASERDPAMAEAFSDEEYRGVMRILQRFYNIIITDCGTGLSHSAMNGVLDLANAIILVSSPAMDGARSAGATLDWLEAHGFGHLVSRAVVVLSSSRPGASTIDTTALSQHFLTRCRAVHEIPFDDHLSEGADVDLDLVSKQTRQAFAELAATIADDFTAASSEREEPFYQ